MASDQRFLCQTFFTHWTFFPPIKEVLAGYFQNLPAQPYLGWPFSTFTFSAAYQQKTPKKILWARDHTKALGKCPSLWRKLQMAAQNILLANATFFATIFHAAQYLT